MIIREVTAEEYRQLFPRPQVVYNSVEFTALNSAKADRIIRAVAVTDPGRAVVGLTAGERGGELFAPFSAPFASLDFNREHSASTMLEVARAFCAAMPGLHLTLPPAPYCTSMNAKTLMSFLAAGAKQTCLDWNYHIDLTGEYKSKLTSPAKNKLHQAERTGFRLEECEPMRAYDIIRRNRESKGYALRMSAEQVLATTGPRGPVKADFMVLTDGTDDAASAMIYHVAEGIAQVIYWGDVPQSPCRNAMNLLAARVSARYAALGFRTLDIGPSGADGYPNIGLSDFKDSIGCICTPRPTLRLPS